MIEARERAAQLRRDFGWPYWREITCEKCPQNASCEFAFDAYNTDGDCLQEK